MASRHLILVAGMHRSGTSALTRAINLAGVPLPSDLKGASPNNQDGFWEPLAIKEFHDRVLMLVGSSWDDPREIPTGFFTGPQAEKICAGLVEWIEHELGDRSMLLVKDPRICRLLPLWKAAGVRLEVGIRTVIIARHPIEVARSLKARDRFPEQLSFGLWLRHFIDAERFTRGETRSFVVFDRLMNERLATIRRIAADLGLSFGVPDSELAALLDEALKPSLRHHNATEDQLGAAAAEVPALRAVWAWAQDAGSGGMPDPATLDRIAALAWTPGPSRPAAAG